MMMFINEQYCISLLVHRVGSTLNIIFRWCITQTGVITATGGATTVAVTAAASDILLGTQANNFGYIALIFGGTLIVIFVIYHFVILMLVQYSKLYWINQLTQLTLHLIMLRLHSLLLP